MLNQLSLVELPEYSAIDVTGADAAKFLQGQLTISVDTPNNSKACLAALCNPKGRIVSLFHIVAIVKGFRLIMPKALIGLCLTHLKKYGVFFKTEIVESELSGLLGLINFTQQQFTTISASSNQTIYQLNALPMAFIPFSAQEQVSQLSTSLEVPIERSSQRWFSSLATNKTCWLSEKSAEEFLPHNLDLPNQNAVDFKKGCFTGQEVIARMHYKGKLKQKLLLLQSDKVSQEEVGFADSMVNEKLIQQDSKVGEVICCCLSEEKRWLVLALVKDSANNQQNFSVKVENSPILELVE